MDAITIQDSSLDVPVELAMQIYIMAIMCPIRPRRWIEPLLARDDSTLIAPHACIWPRMFCAGVCIGSMQAAGEALTMRPPGSLGRKRRLCLLLLRSLRAPDTARCAGAAMCTRPATTKALSTGEHAFSRLITLPQPMRLTASHPPALQLKFSALGDT